MMLITLRSRVHLHALVPAFLVASIYPLMFVVWHGDAVEVERHAFQIAYQIRLAVWMAVAFGLDFLCVQVLARGNAPRAYEKPWPSGSLHDSAEDVDTRAHRSEHVLQGYLIGPMCNSSSSDAWPKGFCLTKAQRSLKRSAAPV